MANSVSESKEVEKLLNAAFETNDLKQICSAVDAAVHESGSSIAEIARAAELDRGTLYRAFRFARGPALDTMIKVLRVLGFRLVVEVRAQVKRDAREEANPRKDASATARRFTSAFKTGEINSFVKAFKGALRAQENVAEFASKTIRTREALYRVFTQNPTPRFSTLLSVLNALDLRFGVRRLRTSKRVSRTCSELAVRLKAAS